MSPWFGFKKAGIAVAYSADVGYVHNESNCIEEMPAPKRLTAHFETPKY
jgi:hypothetical protein